MESNNDDRDVGEFFPLIVNRSTLFMSFSSDDDYFAGSLLSADNDRSLVHFDQRRVLPPLPSTTTFFDVVSTEAADMSADMTVSPDDAGGDPWRASTTGVLLCLVIVFTLTGNSLVVIAVASTRRLRSSVTNYFVVSLAVADLTVAVLVMPYAVLSELYGRWTFGWAFCYFWISCDVTCCTASILHLCVVAVDRYLAVTEPLTYRSRMSKRRAVGAIAAVWTASSAISFVPIYAGWFVDVETKPPPMTLYVDGPMCGLYVNRVYAVVSSTTSFYLPLVVMLVLYAKIFRIARRQSAEIRRLEKSVVGQQLRQSKTTATGGRRHMTGDTKAVKTLGTLMGLFVASWLPFFVVYLIKPFCADRCTVPSFVETAVTWLGYCNSFINPVVYAFLNRDFRSAFRRVLMCGRPVPTSTYDAELATSYRRRVSANTATTTMTSRRLTMQNGCGATLRETVGCATYKPRDGTNPLMTSASSGVSLRLKIVQFPVNDAAFSPMTSESIDGRCIDIAVSGDARGDEAAAAAAALSTVSDAIVNNV